MMNRHWILGGLVAAGSTPACSAESILEVGTPHTLIKQVEGETSVSVQVTLPVVARPQADFTVMRDNVPVVVQRIPSLSTPDGFDLVDGGATYSSRLHYQVVATFPGGKTARNVLNLALVRRYFSFPSVVAPASGSKGIGETPHFRWNTLGLSGARFLLDVVSNSGESWSLSLGEDVDFYDWGTIATGSSGVIVFPRPLLQGLRLTARVTATGGSSERQEQQVSREVAFSL